MNNKNLFVILGVVLIVVAGIFWYRSSSTGGTQEEKRSTAKEEAQKVTIGYTAWPGYIGLYLARDKGYFTEEGLNVEIKKYDGFLALSQAYKDGLVQGKANLTLDAVQEAYDGLDHKAIIAIDHSNGADAIITGPSIKNFSDIKGKKVAFEHGTLEEFFMKYALEQHNFTITDIVPVDLNAEAAAQALVAGKVDAATTYEPFVTETLEKINGNKIFSSKEAPGLITDVLTFRSDFINQYPETVQAIVRAYFKGMQFWQEHPEEATALIAKELGATPDEALKQLEGLNVLDLRDNLTAFTFASGLNSLYGNMRYSGEFIAAQLGSKASKINTDLLVEKKFIRNLSE